jgi:prolyl oligopeptidase
LRVKSGFQAVFLAGALIAAGLVPATAVGGPSQAQRTVAQPIPGLRDDEDPFLWLEQVTSPRALAWVHRQDERTLSVLQRDPRYPNLYREALAIEESRDRIAYPSDIGGAIYNFWQDAHHVHGIWRRTDLAAYLANQPRWTTVLDLDALAALENANWVWKGADCEPSRHRDCLLSLSNGGEDAVTVREFDVQTGRFVPNGFVLPRGKQSTAWVNRNTLLVSRAWQPGEVTASGYPYDVRLLQRGRPLSSAIPVFRGSPSDVAVDPLALRDGAGHEVVLIDRGVTFFTSQYYIQTAHGWRRLNLPPKIDVGGLVDGRLILHLNQAWRTGGTSFAPDSVVAVSLNDARSTPGRLHPTLVFAPGPREAVEDGSIATTAHRLILVILHNVRGRALVFTPRGTDGWSRSTLPLPDNATINVVDTNTDSDLAFLSVTGLLMPTTLYAARVDEGNTRVVRSLPPQFDASRDVVEQDWATSRDGTKVPYFMVRPKSMRSGIPQPTLLTGYGGFAVPYTPAYSPIIGKLWLERGGVYVIANIRGGGEFGPAWHEAAMTIHRQRAYDDFYAVAKDLVRRGITDPRHLGITGASNGGLLMGVEFTQHPEMFNAVDIGVPLLDMMRYEQIAAGASWVGEYGSVANPAQRAFLRSISPYQNLRPGVAYPEPFIWTTTKDDRVGPQAARKFAAKLAAMHVPYFFYEETAGGHAAGANLKESAKNIALQFTYLMRRLM